MENKKPWSVQIEITEGCNRRCSFCGIHSLYREKEDVKYKFMTVELARKIAKDLNNWLGKIRVEFAMQGEPLLNPNYLEIFRAFREEFPLCQIMLTTNTDPLRKGNGFEPKKLRKLFLAGVNILVADYYGATGDMPYSKFKDLLRDNLLGVRVYDFYEDKPKVWAYVGNQVKYIVAIDNTNQRNFVRSVNNQAGNTDPELIQIHGYKIGELPMMKRCHLPFRELAIKHDGSVALCCMDWQREGIMGQFPKQSYEKIWNSEAFQLVRKMLYEKRRDLLSPCDRCNYHPVKVGLIQNPFDKQEDLIQISKKFNDYQKKTRKLSNKYADIPFSYAGLK